MVQAHHLTATKKLNSFVLSFLTNDVYLSVIARLIDRQTFDKKRKEAGTSVRI
jgi:hypothetical protein